MDVKRNLNTMKDEYLKPTPDRRVDQRIVDLVSDFIIPKLKGDRILELGIGDQVWTPKLVDKFADVTSIDGSEELLSKMQHKLAGKHWTPVLSLFEDYNPTCRFDSVLMTYVLEHIENPKQILRLAREKWIKDGGRLVVVVPHALSLHRRLAARMGLASYSGELGDTDRRMGHKQCFTYYEMEKLIIEAGYKIVEKNGMFTKVLPNSNLVQCSNEQLFGMFELGFELPIEYSSIIYLIGETKGKDLYDEK